MKQANWQAGYTIGDKAGKALCLLIETSLWLLVLVILESKRTLSAKRECKSRQWFIFSLYAGGQLFEFVESIIKWRFGIVR